MKIYVKFKKPKTIKEFLLLFYSDDSMTNYGYMKGLTTYSDIECTKVQSNHAYRSYDDLFDLVKTYFPMLTNKIMMNHLLKMKIPKPSEGFYQPHFGTCSSMNRIRFIPYKDYEYSYSLHEKMKNSKYIWNELFKMVNINNKEEFLEKIK